MGILDLLESSQAVPLLSEEEAEGVVDGTDGAFFAVDQVLVAPGIGKVGGNAVLEQYDPVPARVVAVDVSVADGIGCRGISLHPDGVGVTDEIGQQVHHVAAVIEEPGPVGHHQVLDRPDLAAVYDLPHFLEAWVVASLGAHVQYRTVAVAGLGHGVRLAQRRSKALLAEDGLHARLGKGYDDLGVMLDVDGDAHDVEVLGCHHLTEVRVLPLSGHAVVPSELVHEVGAEVRAGNEVGPLGRVESAAVRVRRVEPGCANDLVVDKPAHASAADHSRPVGLHPVSS